MPEKSKDIADRAMILHHEAAALGVFLQPETRVQVAELISHVNCYYSNLMEGQHIHPVYVESAVRGIYNDDPDIRNMQLLSRAHIKIQQLMEERLRRKPGDNISSEEFLSWVHGGFYRRVPRELREFVDPDSGEIFRIIPGKIRDRNIGRRGRIYPDAEVIQPLLRDFTQAYDPASFRDIDKITAVAASHYRLAGIRPFQDGNGRVGRFYSQAFLILSDVASHGLWSLSRGIARNRDSYQRYVDPRGYEYGYDFQRQIMGSEQSLHEFCIFFLDICIEQIQFMKEVLNADHLLARIHKYVSLRATEMEGWPPLRHEVRFLLEAVFLRGKVVRGDTARITGLGERTARSMVSSMLDEGLLESDSHKSPLRPGIPPHVVGWWFPNLYPEGMI